MLSLNFLTSKQQLVLCVFLHLNFSLTPDITRWQESPIILFLQANMSGTPLFSYNEAHALYDFLSREVHNILILSAWTDVHSPQVNTAQNFSNLTLAKSTFTQVFFIYNIVHQPFHLSHPTAE